MRTSAHSPPRFLKSAAAACARGAPASRGRSSQPSRRRSRLRRTNSRSPHRSRSRSRRGRSPRSIPATARMCASARCEYRSGLVLTSSFPRLRRAVGIAARRQGRALHLRQRQGQLVHRPHRLSGPRDDRARRRRGRADARAPTAGRSPRAAGSIRNRSRSTARFVYIGLERVNQVLRYDFSKGFTRARGEVVPMPPAAKKLPYNKGLEALVMVPKGLPLAGTLIALSERGLDAQRQSDRLSGRRAHRRDSSASAAPTISTSATRCCCRPATCWCWSANSPGSPASASVSGALRSPRWRRVPSSTVPSIFDADLGQEIDNMEGIDAHRHAGRRYRADHGVRRQFLADPAHAAAAVHAGGVSVLPSPLTGAGQWLAVGAPRTQCRGW